VKRKSRRVTRDEPQLAYCDGGGTVYEFPGLEPAFRVGRRFVHADPKDLIRLPYGSVIFSLPQRSPVYYNRRRKSFHLLKDPPGTGAVFAASSFLSSGYLRTHLPAYLTGEDAPQLPLWAYCGLVVMNGEFYAPAFRIDDDPRSDPILHRNERALKKEIRAALRALPGNRLVRQLAFCSTEYRCLCARNFFLGRHEAPVPTSPSCNARCLGCLSLQGQSGFCASHARIAFKPSAVEISELILRHVGRTREAVASFGQGCEGEPLLRAREIARAIRMVRAKTDRGTITMNTNGSVPEALRRLIDAGLDSVRISLNSPTEQYYNRYHRPAGYTFEKVKKSLEIALSSGIFVSVNLFFLPGFTDMESEVRSLFKFLKTFPVHMVQTRNLNMDPDVYLEGVGFQESEPLGVRWLISALREKFPALMLGYYNPPKERFRRIVLDTPGAGG